MTWASREIAALAVVCVLFLVGDVTVRNYVDVIDTNDVVQEDQRGEN